MTKIEELRELWKDSFVVPPKGQPRQITGLIIDESQKLYLVRRRSIAVDASYEWVARSHSLTNLPMYVADFLRKNNASAHDPRFYLQVERKLSSDEIRKAMAGYRTFTSINSLRATSNREKRGTVSQIYRVTHRHTGLVMFVSSIEGSYVGLGTLKHSHWANQAFRRRLPRAGVEYLSVYDRLMKSSKIEDLVPVHVRDVSSVDSKRLIRMLNDSIMVENLLILQELQANQPTT